VFCCVVPGTGNPILLCVVFQENLSGRVMLMYVMKRNEFSKKGCVFLSPTSITPA
jgi:hypothetical protein